MTEQNEEEMKKCGHCKKPVMKAKKYYRNNKYYCNQNCWRAAKQKAIKDAQEVAAQAAE